MYLEYVLALLVALGVLVTVHEAGHFLVARMAGVRVLRFAVGVGKPIFTYVDKRQTAFTIGLLPLGGYVRMLDEHERDPAEGKHGVPHSHVSPWWRIAISLGGPAANFVLAIAIYWLVFVIGTVGLVPMIGTVAPDSMAERAGLVGGEEIVAVDGVETPTWQDISMALASRLGESGEIEVLTQTDPQSTPDTHVFPINNWHTGTDEPDLLGSLGLTPAIPAVVGGVLDDSAAQRAGLEPGDRVVGAGDTDIDSWGAWVRQVQQSPGEPLQLLVQRGAVQVPLTLVPDSRSTDDGEVYGFAGVERLTRTVQYSPLRAVGKAVDETWETTVLTLDLLKKMVVGLVSTRNISGPITIAKVTGDSAKSGWSSFLSVLALLSVSLGVINLMPIPILDGGHIVFHTAELITRKPVPDKIQALGMQIGVFMVAGLMILAFYNDIARLL